jgi:hypothetical protein
LWSYLPLKRKTIFMKTVKLVTIVSLLAGALFFSSCNDDDAPVSSREIRFEVSGNFTGTLDATYTTAGGSAVNEDITSLPWVKNITYQTSVPAISILVGGSGGSAGQSITVKVFAGGKEVRSETATANNDGIVVIALQPYVF